MKSEVIFGGVGNGYSIEKGTIQNIHNASTNTQTISNLDITKWYAIFSYQYSGYSNYHDVWTEEQLKAISGIEDAILISSFVFNTSYTATTALIKPSASSITSTLGYWINYFTVTT